MYIKSKNQMRLCGPDPPQIGKQVLRRSGRKLDKILPKTSKILSKYVPRMGNFLPDPVMSFPQAKFHWSRGYQHLQTPGLMALNFFSAVGIVVANKALFRRADGLSFATSLTGLHFIATALGVRVCHAVGIYEVKPLRQTQESVFFSCLWCSVWFLLQR